MHYKVSLLSAAKATGHCALKSVAVVCCQSNWSLCIKKCRCYLLPKQLVTVHYKVSLLSAAKVTGHCALQRVAVVCHQRNWSLRITLLLLLFAAKAGVLLNVPACPEQHGVQTYAHPDLCDHFFKCTNGTVSLERCENGLLYDGKGSVHEHCNYNWAVDCGTRKADRT